MECTQHGGRVSLFCLDCFVKLCWKCVVDAHSSHNVLEFTTLSVTQVRTTVQQKKEAMAVSTKARRSEWARVLGECKGKTAQVGLLIPGHLIPWNCSTGNIS